MRENIVGLLIGDCLIWMKILFVINSYFIPSTCIGGRNSSTYLIILIFGKQLYRDHHILILWIYDKLIWKWRTRLNMLWFINTVNWGLHNGTNVQKWSIGVGNFEHIELMKLSRLVLSDRNLILKLIYLESAIWTHLSVF